LKWCQLFDTHLGLAARGAMGWEKAPQTGKINVLGQKIFIHIFLWRCFFLKLRRFGECQLGCLSGDFEIMNHKLGVPLENKTSAGWGITSMTGRKRTAS